MQRFLREGQEYWGGIHREMGLLLYDPRDQQRLATDKVRLSVVAERRRATFVKAIVRTGLVPSRLETWWCPQHAVVMQPWHNARGTWYSHQRADGTWCTGKAKATGADTPAPPPHHPEPWRCMMSRYSVPAQDPRLTVIVSWDNPLATFFSHVFDPSIEDDDEADLLWIGTALQAQLADWATIPPAIVARLARDQQAATPPTPLQRWAHRLFERVGETRPDRPTS